MTTPDTCAASPAAFAPCPFCRGTTHHLSSNGTGNHFVTCSDCGAEGPAADTEEMALLHWNHRPAPIEAAGELTAERASALEDFFRQLVHGDFMADNPTDLRKALRARIDVVPALREQMQARAVLVQAARYQELRSHAGYSLSRASAGLDLGNYQVSCKVADGEAAIMYEDYLDRFLDRAIAARAAGRPPGEYLQDTIYKG